MYNMITAPDILSCTHPHRHAVRRIDGSGVLKVYEQCPDCGHSFGARRKADYAVESLPWWDEDVIARREAVREAHWQAQRAAFDAQRAEEDAAFQRRYAEYRQTEHWKRLRRRRLLQDNYRCQHCGCEVTEYTAIAHHILPWGYETFRRYGYSMLFEVVTLCTRCHAMAHADKQL